MKKLSLTAAILMFSAAPALAAHNNPWATDDDTVLAKYHEENQEESIGTPGEDEMLGRIVQSASPLAGQGSANGGGEHGSGHGGGGSRH